MIIFSSALELKINKEKMKNFIIDATTDKIILKIIDSKQSYTSDYINSRENFDKLTVLIFKFLDKYNINIREVDNIFINQGPGKSSGIRTSIAIAKALCFSYKIDLYGFNKDQAEEQNYNKIIDLFEKGELKKDLIKLQY